MMKRNLYCDTNKMIAELNYTKLKPSSTQPDRIQFFGRLNLAPLSFCFIIHMIHLVRPEVVPLSILVLPQQCSTRSLICAATQVF